MLGHNLESYLRQLESELAGLSRDERTEIVLETRSHVAERLQRDSSLSVDDVLSDLGEPHQYAREFLPKTSVEHEAGPVGDVATVVTRGWRSLPVLIIVAAGYGIAALLVFIAIAKIAEPDATGWYVRTLADHRSVGLVLSDPNHGGRDVLGYWLVAITLAGAGAIHWMISRLLRRIVRKSNR